MKEVSLGLVGLQTFSSDAFPAHLRLITHIVPNHRPYSKHRPHNSSHLIFPS